MAQDPFTQLLSNQARVQAAQAGIDPNLYQQYGQGYGVNLPRPGVFSRIMSGLGDIGAFVSGVSSAPDDAPGIFYGLNALSNRQGLRQYNNMLAAQQLWEQQQAQEKLRREMADRQAGMPLAQRYGLNADPVYGIDPNSPLFNLGQSDYRSQQNAQGVSQALTGEDLSQLPEGMSPEILQQLMTSGLTRKAAILDAIKTQEQYPQSVQSGAGIANTMYGNKSPKAPAPKVDPNAPKMGVTYDPATGQPMLATGATQQVLEPGPQINNPWNYGVMDPKYTTQGYDKGIDTTGEVVKAGQKDRELTREEKALQETTRHNKAAEAAAMKKAEAAMTNATKPSPSDATSGQTFLNNQVKAIEKQLQSLGWTDPVTHRLFLPKDLPTQDEMTASKGGLLGWGARSEADAAKSQQVYALAKQREALLQKLSGPPAPITPFGGQSQPKLNAARTNAAAAVKKKYGL